MKKVRKILLILFAVFLAAASFPVVSVRADEAPYETYNTDKWGNATPAPHGYLPTRSIGGAHLGCGDFNTPQDLFYQKARHEVYVTDSGNARILVLNEDMELLRELSTFQGPDGEETLRDPEGLFVTDDGVIYIADMGRQEVLVANVDGTFERALPRPESPLLPENFNYLPRKVVVDQAGRIFVLSRGVYQGLMYLEPDGTFMKFFGANEVEMTFQRQVLKIWKSILPDEAARSMQSFNPIEYSNVELSEEGYLYATAAGSENGSKLLTKLNPLGIDCLPWSFRNSTEVFSDVTSNADGTLTMLDTKNGVISQTSDSGSLMFAFGGIGKQLGLFQKPVSLIEVNQKLYVLDADKKTITEFEMTDFGQMVRKAVALYDAGLYQESIAPWEEVTRRNSNYLLAYIGMGKAYYQLKDYEKSMYYFKLANDRADYSLAYKEQSLKFIRENFVVIVLVIIALIIAVPFAVKGVKKLIAKRKKEGLLKVKTPRKTRKGGRA